MRRTDPPPGTLGVPLATARALALGVARSRLRAADVERPFHGVVTIGGAGAGAGSGSGTAITAASTFTTVTATEERCRSLLPLLRPGWAFSHWTAAELYGGALPHSSDDRELHVAVTAPSTPPRRVGVRGHRVAGMLVRWVRGLPVADPGDVWVQMGSLLSLEDLVALGDSLLPARKRPGVVHREDLVTALGHRNHSYGVRAARRALPLLRDGVDSRPETLLRLLVVGAGFPEPAIATPVDVGHGLTLHPDLAYVTERIAIEYEGEHHRTDAWQWHHDLERHRRYEAVGWRQLRVTSDALFRKPREFLATLHDLRARRFGV